MTERETILEELIESLKQQKRPETIKAPVYGLYTTEERTFVYSDLNSCYELSECKPQVRTVRSVKAFTANIKEELKRRGNASGECATVSINLNGGEFVPNDNFGDYKIIFSRLNSQQWDFLKKYINRTTDHFEFLRMLQGLKPSLENAGINFHELFGSFSTLRLIGRNEITSNPIITAEGQTNGYKCTYKLDNGCDGEETFPSGFEVKAPFAKAGDKNYTVPIDLLFTRDDDNQLKITILCPTFENIEEKAIIDECEYIKTETQSTYPDLLILSDF